MRNTTVIPFYLRKTRINSKGFESFNIRVTVNNRRIDLTTNRFVDLLKWSAAIGNIKGTTEEVRTINTYLANLRLKVFKHINALELKDAELNQIIFYANS